MYIECPLISNRPDTYSFQIETIADIRLHTNEVQFMCNSQLSIHP